MKKSKKIAVICNYRLMPERIGGMDRFFWMFDAEAKKKGYEISWFFPNYNLHNNYQNLTVIGIDNQSVEDSFLIYCQQNQIRFDVVITHFVELCTPFYQKVKNDFGDKIIAVDHNPRPLEGYSLIKKIKKKVKGIIFSRYIDVFVGVSEYTKNQMLIDFGSQIEKKTKVIYNGIEHQLYQKRIRRNHASPTFLVASHLRYSKGIQDLIAAVSLLPDALKSKLKIDIYGEGVYKADLLSKVKSAQLEKCFNFKGSVPNLYEIYSQYDYMIQPTHMECFSLSILESLSANVPVITTSVGGNEEVIKAGVNGYIIPPQDILSLKTILENVILGNDKIEKKVDSLIENEFSMEKMVESHLTLSKV
ncbi:MAG: glycosyltransferase family 4 protein [Flavobacteriaceae bacterium]|nr:glycosyltransferase family 4 protein [Flavobacteriaceae bacterium]